MFAPYGNMVSYGTLSLTDTSPVQSFDEPITVAEIKARLRLPAETKTFDDELAVYATAAREQIEIYQNRDLVRKQWDLVLDYWPSWPAGAIELRSPLVSVELLQRKDRLGAITVLQVNTDYVVDLSKRPGVILPAYNTTWPAFTPWPTSAILARFTSGYALDSLFWADQGARAKVAMNYLITEWFTKRLPEGQRNDVAEHLAGFGAVTRVK